MKLHAAQKHGLTNGRLGRGAPKEAASDLLSFGTKQGDDTGPGALHGQSLRLLAGLLAAGYLRLLAHHDVMPTPAPARRNRAKPLDSRGPKSVNGVENIGDQDA
jgi:hypothetical protein